MSDATPVRMLVLWCPDWPVVAAGAVEGVPAHLPAAVFVANRVVVANAVARALGVRRGMRRREAQARCPDIVVHGADADRDARIFEPVAAAAEEVVVGVDVVRPGTIAVPADGAAGYFGGEAPLVELLVDVVSATAGVECQVGVADGLFAATLAAHRGALVERGRSAKFLAPLDIAELDQPGVGRADLVDLLRRLGLVTLGAFAALTEREVASRFGMDGVHAHRLARGRDDRPPHRRRPAPELSVSETFDPPLDRVDVAAFVAKSLAERFQKGLSERGLACSRLGIYASTERGEELGRVWRCAEPLSAQGVADRVRWQFEGWLRAGDGHRPTTGVVRLHLMPEETVAGRSLQLGLWPGGDGGEHTLAAEQAGRALVRVQGLLGPDGVVTAVLDGGRGPGERVRLIPWGERRATSADSGPWPGRLPPPSPATVFCEPVPAAVTDATGAPLDLTGRHRLTGAPRQVVVDGARCRLGGEECLGGARCRLGGEECLGGAPRPVLGWAGPWPVGARWWAPRGQADTARMQVVVANEDGSALALLLTWQDNRNPLWMVEGVYD
jgi:protein ImuB